MFKFAQTLQRSSMLSLTQRRFFASKFNKVCGSIEEALSGIESGHKVIMGGFGLCGVPENLIAGIVKKGVNDLTIYTSNCGTDTEGPGALLQAGLVKKVICSFTGGNRAIEKMFFAGELEVEFFPQGTIAERCRNAVAGVPAFYTATGVGTIVEKGGFPIKFKKGTTEPELLTSPKKREMFNGKAYIQETAFKGDFALIKAWKADTKGNLIFNKTARNMNADFAGAATFTVAEVEEVVEAGELDPDHIHVPGVLVDRVVKGPKYSKRIEKLTLDKSNDDKMSKKEDPEFELREKIARRAAKKIKSGMYINLGIGIPTMVPAYVPADVELELESENGVLGIGKFPKPGQEDADLVNASKETITVSPGGSFFSSSTSFGIIRGGHLDMTILGALQVSQKGDLASWIIPGKLVRGMGGAMDLCASGSSVMVLMTHTAKGGAPKIMKECSLPLTGEQVVSTVVTELATFEFRNGAMVLTEIEEGVTLEEIRAKTACDFIVDDGLKATISRATSSAALSAATPVMDV